MAISITHSALFYRKLGVRSLQFAPYSCLPTEIIPIAESVFSFWFLLSVPIFLLSLIISLHCIIAFKWLIKSTLILTVLMSSLIFYATIDYGMVQNTVEMDSAEAISYLNIYSISFFILFGLVPSIIIYSVNITYKPLLK